MRFIHTADLHLGRLFHGVHLTADQACVLDQLVDLVAEARPQAVLIAGDVYDRAVPPPDAVALLDDVLDRIVSGLGVPVLLVAGNHDSPTRLGFGASLLAERGLHVAGPLTAAPHRLVLRDEHGPVVFHLLPYAEPAVARAVYADDGLHDQAATVAAGIDRASSPAAGSSRVRCVLVTHAFAAGGLTSESERPLTVGGSGAVPVPLFRGFDYVALGHLHRPQWIRADDLPDPAPRVRYSGSPLAYSFDEAGREKSLSLVELGPPTAGGGPAELTVEAVPLRPRRNVRRVAGTLSELLAMSVADPARDDYVEAEIRDQGPVFDAMGRLREAYPNALSVVLPQLAAAVGERRTRPDPKRAGDLELLTAFFEHVCGEGPTEQERAAFTEVADDLGRRERQA
ncbi:MAG: exonuclease SbcCD subunit D [Actinobacteria bacterium]|nr:exonuclease SbcCD subunit D [Actinomycetota bacterium]